MEFYLFLIETMTPDPIFKEIGSMASVVFITVTPVLLVLAAYFRAVEGQMETFSSGGRWSVVIRDFFIFGFVIGLYFPLFSLVVQFINNIYAAFGGHANVVSLMNSMGDAVDKLNAVQDAGDREFSIIAAPFKFVAWLCYFFTLSLLVFLHIFFRIAMALLFGWVLVSGLLAIPVSVTRSLKLLRGWGITLLATLLWPIVESFILHLVSTVMIAGIDTLIVRIGNEAVFKIWGPAAVYSGLAIMCLMIVAAMVASPFVALSFANNTPAVAAVVAPMIGAAVAGAGMAFMGAKEVNKLSSTENLKKGGSMLSSGLGTLANWLSPGGGGGGSGGGGPSGPATSPMLGATGQSQAGYSASWSQGAGGASSGWTPQPSAPAYSATPEPSAGNGANANTSPAGEAAKPASSATAAVAATSLATNALSHGVGGESVVQPLATDPTSGGAQNDIASNESQESQENQKKARRDFFRNKGANAKRVT